MPARGDAQAAPWTTGRVVFMIPGKTLIAGCGSAAQIVLFCFWCRAHWQEVSWYAQHSLALVAILTRAPHRGPVRIRSTAAESHKVRLEPHPRLVQRRRAARARGRRNGCWARLRRGLRRDRARRCSRTPPNAEDAVTPTGSQYYAIQHGQSMCQQMSLSIYLDKASTLTTRCLNASRSYKCSNHSRA